MPSLDQEPFTVRCGWGAQGLAAIAADADVVVIVDVLSFSTAVEIATGRGARVVPARWRGGVSEDAGAPGSPDGETVIAGPRGGSGPSLSPASLLDIAAGTRLVLPSPNGATLSLAVTDKPVLAGCLRNAQAVAAAARGLGDRIAVVPAGERWPDGTLRVALEDWLGTGAILTHIPYGHSPEAEAAVESFAAAKPTLLRRLRACTSGRELVERGFAQDITLAGALDVSACVPRLSPAGAYVADRGAD